MKLTIEWMRIRLKSFTNIQHQNVVFYGNECIATLALSHYPKGRTKPYQLVSTKKKVFDNASFKKSNTELWKQREMELCSIEIILQLISKNNLWKYLDN